MSFTSNRPPVSIIRDSHGDVVFCDIELTVDNAPKEAEPKMRELLNKLASITLKAYGYNDMLDESGRVVSIYERDEEIHVLGGDGKESVHFSVMPESDVSEFVLHYNSGEVSNTFVKNMVTDIVRVISESNVFTPAFDEL